MTRPASNVKNSIMKTTTEYLVSVRHNLVARVESFKDEKKARDYYTDMLVRYPNAEVEFIKGGNKFDV